MIDCKRCRNTGRIMEEYVVFPLVLPLSVMDVIPAVSATIQLRPAECPECMGFSAVPLRLKNP